MPIGSPACLVRLLVVAALVLGSVGPCGAQSAPTLTPSKSLPREAQAGDPRGERAPEPARPVETAQTAPAHLPAQPRSAAARDDQGRVGIPPLRGRVVDDAGLLGASAKADFEARMAALQARRGSQIVLLTLPSTAPESIEQYAIRVFDAWRPGRAGVDDGIVLIVAVQDRSARIEVGRGLEGAVPDAIARRLIDDYLVPHFRVGNYAEGIDAVLTGLTRLIDGEALPAPSEGTTARQGMFGGLPLAVMLAFVFTTLLAPFVGRLRPVLVAAANGIAAVLMASASAVPLWAVVGLVVALLAGGMRGSGRGRTARSGGWGSFGGMPSIGSGGFGGGRGGGGGFSGGGGMSAGGGASGRW